MTPLDRDAPGAAAPPPAADLPPALPAAPEDLVLGRLVSERMLVVPEIMEEALREYHERRSRGDAAALGQILLQRGALGADELLVLLKEISNISDGVPCLPRYEIRGRLGQGATASVFRAWDRELDRLVAIKVLREGLGMTEVARRRFEREAKAAAKLTHPNVVTIYDAGEREGLRYLVMELVEGRPLDGLLSSRALTDRELLVLVEKACRGVAAAHDKGIVHRDLKPGNILVTPGGEPKVGDFGLAHLTDSSVELTRTGAAVGTPLYMAPEQVRGHSRDLSARTDVYALGAILYEALTGRTPHTGDTLMEVCDRVVGQTPRPPRALNPGISPALERIVLKALEKDPQVRYRDAAELADDLRRFLDGLPVEARAPSPARRAWRRVLGHRRIILAFAAGLLLAGGAGAALWLRGEHRAEAARRAFAEGAAHYSAGRLPEALSAYRRVLDLDPLHSVARARTRKIEAEIGRTEHERTARERAVREYPGTWRAAMDLASRRRFEEALRLVREASERLPPGSELAREAGQDLAIFRRLASFYEDSLHVLARVGPQRKLFLDYYDEGGAWRRALGTAVRIDAEAIELTAPDGGLTTVPIRRVTAWTLRELWLVSAAISGPAPDPEIPAVLSLAEGDLAGARHSGSLAKEAFDRKYWAYGEETAPPAAAPTLRAPAPRDTPLPHGLVGWWNFDEGEGPAAADASESAAPSSLEGPLRWVPGRFGLALEFDGRETHVVVPDHARLNPSPFLTVAAWVRADTWSSDLSSAFNARILTKGEDHEQYGLHVYGEALVFILNGSSGIKVSAPPPAPGEWHHVAGTFDGRVARLYVDGELAGSQAAVTVISPRPGPLLIGTKRLRSHPRNYFKGLIDDVRVYSRALGEEEIRALANP